MNTRVDSLVKQWGELHRKAALRPGFWSSDNVEARVEQQTSRIRGVLSRDPLHLEWASHQESARFETEQATFQTFFKAGRLLGGLYIYRKTTSFFGTPVTMGFLDLDVDEPEAWAWAKDAIGNAKAFLTDDFDFNLERGYFELLPTFEAFGVGISAVLLVGEVAQALKALACLEREKPRETMALVHSPHSAADVDEVLALRRRVFALPDALKYCWFALNPAFLKQQELYLNGLEPHHATTWRTRDGQLVAHTTAELEPFAGLGTIGGMNLVLEPAFQGKGLARVFYRHHLGELQVRGIKHFVGASSRPGVLHYGRLFGRHIEMAFLRRSPVFEPAHFGL